MKERKRKEEEEIKMAEERMKRFTKLRHGRQERKKMRRRIKKRRKMQLKQRVSRNK